MKANQLSKTAAFIAIKFYGLTRIESYSALFDGSVIGFYDKLVQFLPSPLCRYHKWLKFKWIRKFYIASEELLLPGDLMHVLARKWYIRRMAEDLVDQGYEQLIVLGAGFDHLSHHYAQQGLRCFEFDAPYMAGLKRDFLKEAYPHSHHPSIIDSHFPADSFSEILQQQPGLDPAKKTIIVAEGFFDYLPSHTVNSLFITIKEYFSHNAAIISTHFALNELPRFHRWVFKTSVNLVDEKLQFNSSMYEFEQLL
ncbi:MAG TPA: class I SAM-dependent methyltransferase, partial [Balneolaceae bacterium]|nr:class I SAM-dependent methyltransferase [Balneolaceae bacterium]